MFSLHSCFRYSDLMGMRAEVWPSSPFFYGKRVFVKSNLVVPVTRWDEAGFVLMFLERLW